MMSSLDARLSLSLQVALILYDSGCGRKGQNNMQRVLITGAAGGIGSRLRKLLKGVYPEIRWSDLKVPSDLAADEQFARADLSNMDEVEKIVAGMQGIVHMGGFSVEGPWETILSANI